MSGSSTFCPVMNWQNFQRWLLANRGFGSLVACLILAFVVPIADLSAKEPAASSVRLGWDSLCHVGRWTPAVMDVEITEAGDYQVLLTAPDPDGNRVTYSTSVSLQAGRQHVHGYFKAGRLNADVDAKVVSANSDKVVFQGRSTDSVNPLTLLSPATRLIVTTGQPAGFDWEGNVDGKTAATSGPAQSASARFRTMDVAVNDLPDDAMAYDSVSVLALAGQSIVSASQAQAIRDWVSAGGRLIVSLPPDLGPAQQVLKPLSDWFPVRIGSEEVVLRNFGKLEFFAGRNIRIPFQGRMSIPGLQIEHGEYLAGGKEDALLVRAPYGLGSVTVLAVDMSQPPLSKWSEVAMLARRMAEASPDSEGSQSRSAKSRQISSNGVSDFATQVHAIQEDFSAVTRSSPWFVMGLLSVFMIVIGPIDYLIVHRILKWARATWITLPFWIVAGTALSASLAGQWNGSTSRINQLNLINVDAETAACHQMLWTNLYSPETTRKSVSVNSVLAAKDSSRQSSWSGVPEASFGGMLRPTGLDLARADYHQTLQGEFSDLPFVQWSTKSLSTEVHSHVDRLVESDLKSNPAGRLTGSLTHRFQKPLEDWFIVYGNRVYRQMKQREDTETLPLYPHQPWRVEQANVYQRELRAFLTGEVALSKNREGSQQKDVIQRRAEYDPLSRDPLMVFRTLTFYRDSGGGDYTSLTNAVLDAEDLSHLVKLGRAVLFGRLTTPVATIQVDGQSVKPDRELSFVRLILPVQKTDSDAPPELQKLGE